MDSVVLLEEAVSYLGKQFPLELDVVGRYSVHIPFHLKDVLEAFMVRIKGVEHVFICIDDMRSIEKNNYYHLKWIITSINKSIVFVSREQIKKKAKEIIESGGVGWIIPKKSIYIPSVFISSQHERIEKNDIFGTFVKNIGIIPTYIIAYYISGKVPRRFTGSNISDILEISKMSSSRAIQSLLDEGLVSYESLGREKIIHFNLSPKSIFIKTMNRLSKVSTGFTYGTMDEIKERDYFISGESALSKYSMMSNPSIEQYGIYLYKEERYKKTISERTINSPYLFNSVSIGLPRNLQAESNILIQIYPYKPIINHGVISDLFLFLSDTISRDPRVRSCLEEIKISIINSLN